MRKVENSAWWRRICLSVLEGPGFRSQHHTQKSYTGNCYPDYVFVGSKEVILQFRLVSKSVKGNLVRIVLLILCGSEQTLCETFLF